MIDDLDCYEKIDVENRHHCERQPGVTQLACSECGCLGSPGCAASWAIRGLRSEAPRPSLADSDRRRCTLPPGQLRGSLLSPPPT